MMEQAIDYKTLHDTFTASRYDIEDRVWHIIVKAEKCCDYDTPEGLYKCLFSDNLPATYHGDWEVNFNLYSDGLLFHFFRTEPYEDWTEERTLYLSWEELQCSDEEIDAMCKVRGKALHDKQLEEDEAKLMRLAEGLGYIVEKI